MQRIILTGGAGYIGSILNTLIDRNHYEVIIIDPCWFGTEPIDNQHHFVSYERFKKYQNFIPGDICIHLGGLSNDPMADYSPIANDNINFYLTKRIAEDFGEADGGRFIFASSASVYGYTDEIVDEGSFVNPKSAYATSKVAAEMCLKAASKEFDFNLVILRKGTLMGVSRRMRYDLVVNTMVKTAIQTSKIFVTGAKAYRPLASVKDAAECYNFLIDCELPEKWNIYNLVHENITIGDLAELISGVVGEVEIDDLKMEECRSYFMKGNKLTELGFTPKTTIAETVQEVLDYTNANNIDLNDPIYYNIKWLQTYESVCKFMGIDFDLERMYYNG